MAHERLILTGFMGVGKTTAGRLAARALEVPFYDTDEHMQASGVDVPQLVATDESAFRRIEAATLRRLAGFEQTVISTGGGIVSTELGRQTLRDSGVPRLWLRAPFDVLAERVANDPQERPLFADVDRARELFVQRELMYAAVANLVLDATKAPESVAADIISVATEKRR